VLELKRLVFFTNLLSSSTQGQLLKFEFNHGTFGS